MTYRSIESKNPENYKYNLKFAHLYGDLMNTYGDNGNILMLKYVAEKLSAATYFDIVSLGDKFDKDKYDFVFWGGGQDYEQEIISNELSNLTEPLREYIEADKPVLGICGGYQMLGKYYTDASGKKINCTGILGHYTENPGNDRIIGDVEIYNAEFDETYYGFENHGGRTYLSDNENALGMVKFGGGNNATDGTEGLHYRNVFGTYFHGPILAKNPRFAYRLITIALQQKYGQIELPTFDEIFPNEETEKIQDIKRKA